MTDSIVTTTHPAGVNRLVAEYRPRAIHARGTVTFADSTGIPLGRSPGRSFAVHVQFLRKLIRGSQRTLEATSIVTCKGIK